MPTKAPAKAKAAAKTPAKTATKKAGVKRGPANKGGGAAFSAPLKPSSDLALVVGEQPLARTEAVSKIWEYIRTHNLQNPQNKREIMADDRLKAVFDGKDKVTMFELNKYLSKHLEKQA